MKQVHIQSLEEERRKEKRKRENRCNILYTPVCRLIIADATACSGKINRDKLRGAVRQYEATNVQYYRPN